MFTALVAQYSEQMKFLMDHVIFDASLSQRLASNNSDWNTISQLGQVREYQYSILHKLLHENNNS